MRTRLLGILALALTATATLTALQPTGREKLVLVTVVAGEGQPAAGLTPADFTISEERDKVEVLEAVPARDPLSIVLLVDKAIPEGMAATTPEIRRALTTFVSTVQAAEPAAQIAIYHVANAAIPLVGFTSDRGALDKAIETFASGTEPGSAMLEGVLTAANLLQARPAPRRAIVCVSVGTRDGGNWQPDKVRGDVRKSGATLWVVSIERSSDPSLTNRDTVWTRVTEDTGGLRQNAVQASRVEPPLKLVANSLVSQYTLKLSRKKDGAVKGFKGQTTGGSQVLFTHWMR